MKGAIRIVHARLTENNQSKHMKINYSERLIRARSVEFIFEHTNHLVYYLTSDPVDMGSVSLTIYSPSTQVYNTTTHQIPPPYPSKYLHSLKRERIYAFSLSKEHDCITIMDFSFDFTLQHSMNASLPSIMNISHIDRFVAFKDIREEIVLMIAENSSDSIGMCFFFCVYLAGKWY